MKTIEYYQNGELVRTERVYDSTPGNYTPPQYGKVVKGSDSQGNVTVEVTESITKTKPQNINYRKYGGGNVHRD